MCTIYLNFTECVWPQPLMIFTNWDEFKIPKFVVYHNSIKAPPSLQLCVCNLNTYLPNLLTADINVDFYMTNVQH